MDFIPIQVIDNRVIIPLHYFNDAEELELIIENGYVTVRPKEQTNGEMPATSEQDKQTQGNWLANVVGIIKDGDPNDSSRVEEILYEEIDRHSGWTIKEKLSDEDLE